jgi:hypothetical protein
MNACGFILVRKPLENFDPIGKGIWPRQAPHINGIYYGGVWRMPWYDIDRDLRARSLPPELRDLYLATVSDPQGTSFALCKSLESAKRFLEHANHDEEKCELIAIYSPRLASMKGTISISGNSAMSHGWEPFQIGGGSLVVDGIFAVPARFAAWQEKLNESGLLATPADGLLYIEEYQRLAQAGLLEALFPQQQCPIESVEVISVTA